MAKENRPWTRQGEKFWRAHHEAWKRSDLNQRQYCEAQGIPLKAFGNWRADIQRRATCARAASRDPQLPPALRLPDLRDYPPGARPGTANSPRGWPPLPRSPMFWSPNIAITCPLYRQSQFFARHGVEIDRSTLANWVGGACWWLEPLQARLAAHVFASPKLFADDTPIPVLIPAAAAPRPAGSGSMRATIDPGPDRNRRPPSISPARIAGQSVLPAISGTSVACCKVAGYAGFERLTMPGTIVLAACRVGGDVAIPAPHRPGRADYPHPVLHA